MAGDFPIACLLLVDVKALAVAPLASALLSATAFIVNIVLAFDALFFATVFLVSAF